MLGAVAPQLVPATFRRDTPCRCLWTGRCEGKAHCVTADGTSSRHCSHAIGNHLQFAIYSSKWLRALSDPELRTRPGSITKVGERRKRRSAQR